MWTYFFYKQPAQASTLKTFITLLLKMVKHTRRNDQVPIYLVFQIRKKINPQNILHSISLKMALRILYMIQAALISSFCDN